LVQAFSLPGNGLEDSAAELPPVPLQRGAAVVERDGLQPGDPWRRPGLPKRIENWSLASLQQRFTKTGGRLV
jgi:hypothetical protein